MQPGSRASELRAFLFGGGGDMSVLAWTQPELPPLPEGEAQHAPAWEVYGAKAKHPPQTAPGYLSAQRLGLLPPPAPSTPPQRLPGPSAQAMLLTGIGLFFGTIVAVIMLPDTTPALPYPAVMTVGGGGAFWMMAHVGVRERAEFAAGYTSRTAFLGLWRLGRGGAVLREPDRNVPPPGFYPSPYQPGLLQRWDGPGWHPFTPKWRRRPYK